MELSYVYTVVRLCNNWYSQYRHTWLHFQSKF